MASRALRWGSDLPRLLMYSLSKHPSVLCRHRTLLLDLAGLDIDGAWCTWRKQNF